MLDDSPCVLHEQSTHRGQHLQLAVVPTDLPDHNGNGGVFSREGSGSTRKRGDVFSREGSEKHKANAVSLAAKAV